MAGRSWWGCAAPAMAFPEDTGMTKDQKEPLLVSDKATPACQLLKLLFLVLCYAAKEWKMQPRE
jgi:hypothetical protein